MKRPDRLEGGNNFSLSVPLGTRLAPDTLTALRNLAEKLREDDFLKKYSDLAAVGQEVMEEGGRGVYSPRRAERHLRIGNRRR